MGKLLGISVRLKSRAPMQAIDKALIAAERGVENDFRGRPGRRQVTVIAREDWDRVCEALQVQLPWTTRRANLLIEGVDLRWSRGKTIYIGSVVLEITGETKPCERMEEAHAGLYQALVPHWRGGVTCAVVTEGKIRIGDTVTVQRASRP